MGTKLPLLFIFVFSTAPLARLSSQWSASPEISVVRFSGTARDTSGHSIGPYGATAYGIRIDRQAGRWRFGLGLFHGTTGLVETGGGFTLILEDELQLTELVPTVSFRLVPVGDQTELWLEAGPAVIFWKPKDVESRTRGGAQATLAWEIRLSHRYSAVVRAGGSVSSSVFGASETPPDVVRRVTWCRGASFAIRMRL